MQASDGDGRVTAAMDLLRRVVGYGPRWQQHRAFTAGAAAVLTALAVAGVVALPGAGSASSPRVRDAAASAPASSAPKYLLPIGTLVQDGSLPAPVQAGDTGTVGVPAGTPKPPTTPPAVRVPSNDITTYRGATGTLTPAGIATLALEAGCTPAQAPVATAVAMAESGGSPSAQGDVTLMTTVWDWSAGLWQIRGLRAERGTGALRDSIANQAATTNAAAMYAVSNSCADWGPWTTYTRGLYLSYLPVAQQAVSYVLAYRQSHGHYPPVGAPDPNVVIPVAAGGAGGGAQAAPASSNATAARPAPRPTATPTPRSTAAPTGSTGGTAQSRPTGGAAHSTTPAPQSTPTPTKTSAKPVLPLPTLTVPLPLPKPSASTSATPVCVLVICLGG